MTPMEHTPGRVLVIEDEPQLLEATVTYLNMEGFVADGVAGLHAAAVLVHQLAQRDAGRGQMHAGLVDPAREREGTQALAAAPP